jgi:hypothetical protein
MINVGHDAFICHPRRPSAGIHLSSFSLVQKTRWLACRGYSAEVASATKAVSSAQAPGSFGRTQGMLFRPQVRDVWFVIEEHW